MTRGYSQTWHVREKLVAGIQSERTNLLTRMPKWNSVARILCPACRQPFKVICSRLINTQNHMNDIGQKAQRALDSSHLPLSLCLSSPLFLHFFAFLLSLLSWPFFLFNLLTLWRHNPVPSGFCPIHTGIGTPLHIISAWQMKAFLHPRKQLYHRGWMEQHCTKCTWHNLCRQSLMKQYLTD